MTIMISLFCAYITEEENAKECDGELLSIAKKIKVNANTCVVQEILIMWHGPNPLSYLER